MQVLSPADRLYSGNSASRSDSLPRETGSFMSALANMTEAEVFFLSPDFVILLANDAAATALGVSRSHLIGHRIDEVLPEFYSHIEMISTELGTHRRSIRRPGYAGNATRPAGFV